jgi:hypothetical protein
LNKIEFSLFFVSLSLVFILSFICSFVSFSGLIISSSGGFSLFRDFFDIFSGFWVGVWVSIFSFFSGFSVCFEF